MIRAVEIGLGKMGISHCAVMNAHEGVDFVGAAETAALPRWILGQHSSIPIFDDYKEMLATTKPHCVVIATPTSTHFDIANYCLTQDIHVFLEKPCCLNYRDSTALRKLAEERQLLLQVGYHNRYIGTFREAKRLIDTGVIGPVYNFCGQAFGPVVIKKQERTWRSVRREGGGCLYDYASHVINLLQFLLGTVTDVRGTRLEKIFSTNVEDAVYSTLSLSNGVTGQLAVNWSEESFRKMTTDITVSGLYGRLEVNAQQLKLFLNSNSPQADQKGWRTTHLTDHTEPVNYYLRGEEYSAQLDDFFSCVENGKTESINSISSAGETDRVIELLIADSESKASGTPSQLPNTYRRQNQSSLFERLRMLVIPKRT